MPNSLTLGAAAVRLGIMYSQLYKRTRREPALPGLVMFGRYTGVLESKLDELRAVLVSEGLLKEPTAAATA